MKINAFHLAGPRLALAACALFPWRVGCLLSLCKWFEIVVQRSDVNRVHGRVAHYVACTRACRHSVRWIGHSIGLGVRTSPAVKASSAVHLVAWLRVGPFRVELKCCSRRGIVAFNVPVLRRGSFRVHVDAANNVVRIVDVLDRRTRLKLLIDQRVTDGIPCELRRRSRVHCATTLTIGGTAMLRAVHLVVNDAVAIQHASTSFANRVGVCFWIFAFNLGVRISHRDLPRLQLTRVLPFDNGIAFRDNTVSGYNPGSKRRWVEVNVLLTRCMFR